MSGKAAGRLPPIRTANSVHQRSLSRSSNASGSVPNSPKTHELFHFDDTVSKVAESQPEADAERKVVPDNAEEAAVAEKAPESTVVRDANALLARRLSLR